MRYWIRGLNALFSLVVLLCFFVVVAYAGYALWDNSQVYAAAENVRDEMLQLKPQPAAEEGGPTFHELQAVNPDVCAWVTLDNTNIDHPVLQGTDNLSYINRDVYGNFSLAGSVFLDSRNDTAFADPIPCCMAITWKTAGCSGIWICIRTRNFSGRTEPAF